MIFHKDKVDPETLKARRFAQDVMDLSKKYKLPFFFVTDGASTYSNNGNDAIKAARESHEEWEKKNGFDPHHDWSKDMRK